ICLSAWAGGIISPADGTYTFHRTNPAPATDVGTGQFSTDADGSKSLVTNPGPGAEKWKKQPDGTYRKEPSGHLSICFEATESGTPPYNYVYKLDGVPTSSGQLIA